MYRNPATGFYFDSETEWKSLSGDSQVEYSGRFLGGCISTLRTLIGTPFDQVDDYVSKYAAEEGVVWYLESVGLNAINIYRSLWQMKQAGWFKHVNGILIGRPSRYSANQDFQLIDALNDIFGDQHISVLYDVDIGHAPPQNIVVNGAFGKVMYNNLRGTIQMDYI
ncbi:hypothetical protein [Planococcus maritimus]|uniref:hypothetical protein n=1 Tax=Planococcus maritimus TaxID=192421 RepID=UPI0031389BF5